MRYHFPTLATLAMLGVLLSSCNEDNVTEPDALQPQTGVVTMRNIAADTSGTTGMFTYVRLRDSVIVAVDDSSTTNWDISFRSTTLRVNCGASGPGLGGAIVLGNVDFDTLSTAPASGYAIDTTARPSTQQLAITTGSGNGWYNYDPATNIISPIPGTVLVVKTADGKYAKIQITSYYRNAPAVPTATDAPRFYTIRYFYQADGSRTLR